jgi:hypothetical protein
MRLIALVSKKFFFLSPPWENKGDLYRFDIAESRYGNQHAVSPTTLKGQRFKVKNYIFSKKG